MLSKGYINIRIIALILVLLAKIPFVGENLFYGRNIEMLDRSVVSEDPRTRDDGAGIDFAIENEGGRISCSLSYCGKEGWRLQSEYDGEVSDYGAAQLLAYYLGEEDPCGREPVKTEKSRDRAVLTAPDGSFAELSYAPFGIVYKNKNGEVSAEVTDLAVKDGNTVVRGKLKSKEAMWGSGQHFDTVNQRGQHIEINAVDKWAQIERNSYLPIPILVSSRGSGLFMNRYEKMTIDVDSRIVPKNTWQMVVPGAPCDLFVYTTEKPEEVLYGYQLLTGFSPVPADWNYGTVVCRYSPEFTTLQGVKDMAAAMENNDFPWEGVIVEGFDCGNGQGLSEMAEYLHGAGKKLMIYTATGTNPFSATENEDELAVKRASNGSPWLVPANSDNQSDNPDGGTWRWFDVTSERAKDYIIGGKFGKAVAEQGIDGAKVDFCELFPDEYELIFEDGETKGAHHWYPTVYNTVLFNELNKNPGGTMTINRGGSIGAQRYPWIWMGDQKREFPYIAAQLKAVMSLGISGVPFGTFDMGGYKSPADNETDVFRRSVEFTAFTGNIQTHGTVKRPYDYDDFTKDIYRKYAKIHDALRPYLSEQGKISAETALPLVRHLAVSYWNDEKVWNIEDEFMLGNKLLVAPVLSSATRRNIYLPWGNWTDLWTGKKYKGGQTLKFYSVPIDEIPVFVNDDAVSEAFDLCVDEVRAIHGGTA